VEHVDDDDHLGTSSGDATTDAVNQANRDEAMTVPTTRRRMRNALQADKGASDVNLLEFAHVQSFALGDNLLDPGLASGAHKA